ncbi:MAG: Fis family transcriptional regulator [Marinilabiliales bacterium]|nr:MAG: Fis family transcriptional regulator [Marinilabiliales bacterium]
MSNTKSIEHKGRIDSIEGHKISVNFLAMSGCASCHAKGVCTVADMKEKSVEVYDFTGQYAVGEEVSVTLKQSLGFRALLLGYVLPFVLVLFVLIALTAITNNEAIAGLSSLSVLVPYYLILFFLRDKIRKKFTFTIDKI